MAPSGTTVPSTMPPGTTPDRSIWKAGSPLDKEVKELGRLGMPDGALRWIHHGLVHGHLHPPATQQLRLCSSSAPLAAPDLGGPGEPGSWVPWPRAALWATFALGISGKPL